jgi:hypothetical protein
MDSIVGKDLLKKKGSLVWEASIIWDGKYYFEVFWVSFFIWIEGNSYVQYY